MLQIIFLLMFQIQCRQTALSKYVLRPHFLLSFQPDTILSIHVFFIIIYILSICLIGKQREIDMESATVRLTAYTPTVSIRIHSDQNQLKAKTCSQECHSAASIVECNTPSTLLGNRSLFACLFLYLQKEFQIERARHTHTHRGRERENFQTVNSLTK